MDTKETILKFYEKFSGEADPARRVGWMQKHTQRLNFIELEHVFNDHLLPNDTVLDVGCGIGAFACAFMPGQYTGWDINPVFIEEARRANPDVVFEVQDVLTQQECDKFDWVMASGAASIKIGTDEEQYRHAFNLMARMYLLCRKGMAINFLTYDPDLAKQAGEEVFLYRPERILAMARKLDTKVVLNHDFQHDSFSVFIYKNHNRVLDLICDLDRTNIYTDEEKMAWLLKGGLSKEFLKRFYHEGVFANDFSENLYTGMAFLLEGDFKRSRAYLEMALRMSPEDKTPQYYLDLIGKFEDMKKVVKEDLNANQECRNQEVG